MNRKKVWFALAGMALLALGFFLQNLTPYKALLVVSSAASCQMRVDVVEPISGTPQGYAVLFHGVAANKRIMSFLAQDLANQNLRVFVPDFPGHGRTPAPFWPMRANDCGEAFVRELIERRAIVAERTILAGHSMGGAIAIRVSGRVPVAGVIALSPAPMRTAKMLSKELVFFPDDPPLAKNSLVLVGSREPEQFREIGQAKVREAGDGTSKYVEIPHATHVSMLFDGDVLSEMRKWIAPLLGTDPEVVRATRVPLYGALTGLAGLIFLSVPFVAEISGGTGKETKKEEARGVLPTRALMQVLAASAVAGICLKLWVPLRAVGLFQGDYLASFLLIAGLILLVLHRGEATSALKSWWPGILAAGVGAIGLLLLFTLWLDYSFYEAWLNAPRWARMAPLAAAFLPWMLAEEIYLGAHASNRWIRRVITALTYRGIAWVALVAALYLLHSGEILMVLLALYFVIVSVLQRLAMDVVRRETQSPAAAAVFGAILSGGFALAIFPLA
jgi:pimeloyl-ACP methyl ester carboxylesterase